MIVKDEEQFLADCLESVRDVVDEINIVDTGSTDRTVAIAKSFGAKVIVRPWRDDFGWARNESLAMATGRWVLVLDADETITPESRRFLQSLRTEEPGDKALFVRIINDVEDEAGTATFSHFLPRIFPVSPRIRYGGAIHELLKLDDKLITGELSVVEILHRGYTSDTSKARAKSERNLPLLRRELAQHPDDPFALFNFGFCAVQQQPELIEEGIAALEQMMHVGTNEPFLTIGISALATTYARRKNNCARALLILELAEERLPPDSDIIFTHGTVLNMLGRFEEGRALWKRLIDAPDAYRHRPLVDDEIFKWKAPFNIALSYIAEGRYAESLVWIERAQEQKPNSTFIVTRTAAALEQAGAENEAERQYRRWAELEREKGTVELIKFLMRRQRPADAAEVIVKSPWLPPVETVECGIAVATAMIESRAGRPEDLLELVLRLEPANGEALFLYERVMTARTEAVRKAELAAECRSAADFFRRSNRLLELGRHAEAAAAAARAIELDPAHSAAAYTLALATLNQGDEHEAVRLFGLVPTTDHKVFGSAMAARAHLLEEHGDIPGVIATLSRWLDVHWQSHWVTTIPDVSLHRATSAEKANVLR